MNKLVLDEYIPLVIPSISIAIGPEWEREITYGHFEWCLKSDIEKNEDYTQTFKAGQSIELLGYSGLLEGSSIDINKELEGKQFRLPDVSYAFGGKTLILSDKAAAITCLSKKSGTITGTATLQDPFGRKHPGYSYISFKPHPT